MLRRWRHAAGERGRTRRHRDRRRHRTGLRHRRRHAAHRAQRFELLEGTPAESEAALVAAGYLPRRVRPVRRRRRRVAAPGQRLQGVGARHHPRRVGASKRAGDRPRADRHRRPVHHRRRHLRDDDRRRHRRLRRRGLRRELADIFTAAGERFVAREGRAPSRWPTWPAISKPVSRCGCSTTRARSSYRPPARRAPTSSPRRPPPVDGPGRSGRSIRPGCWCGDRRRPDRS